MSNVSSNLVSKINLLRKQRDEEMAKLLKLRKEQRKILLEYKDAEQSRKRHEELMGIKNDAYCQFNTQIVDIDYKLSQREVLYECVRPFHTELNADGDKNLQNILLSNLSLIRNCIENGWVQNDQKLLQCMKELPPLHSMYSKETTDCLASIKESLWDVSLVCKDKIELVPSKEVSSVTEEDVELLNYLLKNCHESNFDRFLETRRNKMLVAKLQQQIDASISCFNGDKVESFVESVNLSGEVAFEECINRKLNQLQVEVVEKSAINSKTASSKAESRRLENMIQTNWEELHQLKQNIMQFPKLIQSMTEQISSQIMDFSRVEFPLFNSLINKFSEHLQCTQHLYRSCNSTPKLKNEVETIYDPHLSVEEIIKRLSLEREQCLTEKAQHEAIAEKLQYVDKAFLGAEDDLCHTIKLIDEMEEMFQEKCGALSEQAATIACQCEEVEKTLSIWWNNFSELQSGKEC